MLIDEAQDLPREFLRMARLVTRSHRIVWAYDDLQNLGDYQVQSLRDTFGTNEQGAQIVELENHPKQPRQDIILPRCYRNTPWALVTAHALGSGIYRAGNGDSNLVQHPDDPLLWKDIGYSVREGALELGSAVVLERDPNASPAFFRELLNRDDAVQFLRYGDDYAQLNAIAEMIRTNITNDELYPHDIVVIFPDAITWAKKGARFQQMLREREIQSHVAGVTSSRDVFLIEGSVTITGAYRAKGNEAPMVYLADTQYCAAGPELIKRRNTLFTSVTRSRAWVRICGYGEGAEALEAEFNQLRDNQFWLRFTIPTREQLQRMRTQYRDITRDERKRVAKLETALESVLVDGGDDTVLLKSLPKELRDKLRKALLEE
jgi:superfamily I DNA and RNA helicase